MKGLIAKKIGMTQFFAQDGRVYPVTVLEAGPNAVIQKKTAEGKDGYNAVKLGFGSVHKHEKEGTEPRWRMTKPMVGVFQKVGVDPVKVLREFRVKPTELDAFEVGTQIGPGDMFMAGNYVDVSGTTKGRGFTGVMKRHNFHGARSESHGTHENFRHAGSIGSSADPARVLPGLRMPGQHGNCRSTVMSLHVIEIDAEKNLIIVKGGVPGPNGGIVEVRQSAKRPKAFKSPNMIAEAPTT